MYDKIHYKLKKNKKIKGGGDRGTKGGRGGKEEEKGRGKEGEKKKEKKKILFNKTDLKSNH